MRAPFAFAFALVLALAPAAAGAEEDLPPIFLRSEGTARATLALGDEGPGEARFVWKFAVDEPGEIYVKVATTPWSPLDGNGTVDGGVAYGWAARLLLADGDENELLRDGRGHAVDGDLGVVVDGSSTRAIAVAPGETYSLIANVRAPPSAVGAEAESRCPQEDAPEAGTLYCLNFAIAFKPAVAPDDGSAGGRIEPSVGARGVLVLTVQAGPLSAATWALAGATGLAATAAATVLLRRTRWRPSLPWPRARTPAAPAPAAGPVPAVPAPAPARAAVDLDAALLAAGLVRRPDLERENVVVADALGAAGAEWAVGVARPARAPSVRRVLVLRAFLADADAVAEADAMAVLAGADRAVVIATVLSDDAWPAALAAGVALAREDDLSCVAGPANVARRR